AASDLVASTWSGTGTFNCSGLSCTFSVQASTCESVYATSNPPAAVTCNVSVSGSAPMPNDCTGPQLITQAKPVNPFSGTLTYSDGVISPSAYTFSLGGGPPFGGGWQPVGDVDVPTDIAVGFTGTEPSNQWQVAGTLTGGCEIGSGPSFFSGGITP